MSEKSNIDAEAFEDFERMFHRWMDEGSNQEGLELGGTGDLKTLASHCFAWASRHKVRELYTVGGDDAFRKS